MCLQAVAETAAGQKKAALGKLPEWNLSDLYPGLDSPALTEDLARLADSAAAFHQRCEGKLAGL
jgi:oligoendopeptidase F